jgi:lipopolysaccharide/colanic/teichoic acid biosynthesis glycosyltransferase
MVRRAVASNNRCMPSPNAPKLTLKHGIDRVIAFLVLMVLAPLMIAIAVAVRLSSPGPVLFRRRRVGRGGHGFDLYTSRTVRDEPADARFELPSGVAPGGVEGSDRRTWIGRWLRASSLDELPRFLNVVRGEMSVIGPRPERPDYAKRFALTVPGYIDRLRVNAGITGWAQANGLRGQTPIADRVAYDNYYIDHWSLRLELRTVVLAAVEILRFRDRPAQLAAPRREERVGAGLAQGALTHRAPADRIRSRAMSANNTALIGIRASVGAGAWVAPQLAGRLFGLDTVANPQLPYMGRLFGIRDVALAAGLSKGVEDGASPPMS